MGPTHRALGLALALGAVCAAPRAAAQSRFRPGDRVEVDVGGTWHPATVASVQNGRYAVHRDVDAYGVSSSAQPVSADRLRPLVVRPAAAPRPAAGSLPSSIPAGRYVCTTYAGYSTTLGVIRVVGDGAYTGMNASGTGPRQRFAYDAGSGAVRWAGGRIPGLAWPVQDSRYAVDARGNGFIVVHYQLRAGGNVDSMSCTREGA